jgi:hypothetical protein
MSKPVSLINREIETKIDAALRAEIAKGKKPSDMGVRDFHGIAESLRDKVSPAARDELVRQGLEHMVKFVLGAMIAEVIWKDGTGWPANDEQILVASRRVTVKGQPVRHSSDDQAIDCFQVFRETLPDMTRTTFHEACDEAIVSRFRALFIGQSDDRTLGEIAVVKAANGDRLAMSFLAWRPL